MSAASAGKGCVGWAVWQGNQRALDDHSPRPMTIAMPPRTRVATPPASTPVREVAYRLLGVPFRFEATSSALLALLEATYGGLPAHTLPVDTPECVIELKLLPARQAAAEPEPVRQDFGPQTVSAWLDAANFTLIKPAERHAVIAVTEDMLEQPYSVRQELLEFTVFVLAARVAGLVPLHGACLGHAGKGVLVLGDSGAGKSTLVTHALMLGLDIVSEDAVFVHPAHGLATGIANYLHLRQGSPTLPADVAMRDWLERAPIITRNSGIQKHEADLRRGPARLASQPVELAAIVVANNHIAPPGAPLLSPLAWPEAARCLQQGQPYASTQAPWAAFMAGSRFLDRYTLRRGAQPIDSARAIAQLL